MSKKYELIPGEEIIYEGRLSKAYVYLPLIVSVVSLVASVALLLTDNDTLLMIGVLLLALAAIELLSFARRFFYMKTVICIVTNKSLIQHAGFINKYDTEIPLDKVLYFSVKKNIIGRIFNYGTGSGIRGLADPLRFKHELFTAADAYKTGKPITKNQ